MGPVFYVMAILGCGDGGGQCAQARIEPTRFQSVEQCQAQLPAALARNTDLSFPTVSATCRASGAMIAKTESRTRRG
jgi:hypothetical protein